MTVTKSFSVEFDDALLDLEGWKNPRYEGTKLTGAKINKYTEGDITYGLNPVVENKTTALYIGNTLIDAQDEDEQYAHIKNHSYVDINRILLINPLTDEITLIDATQEAFQPFHRFVTTDLPTGGTFDIRLLDYSIPNGLSVNTKYYVKMNKGWLLKSFKYGEFLDNDTEGGDEQHTSSLGIFTSGSNSTYTDPNYLQFQFGTKKTQNTTVDYSPSYVDASIISNKFTDRYYSGSYSFPSANIGSDGAFGSASRFLGYSTLNYLNSESLNTEVHLTLFDGTFDFAPGFNDERSISTFEIDSQIQGMNIRTPCLGGGLGLNILTLKGQEGSNFWPTTPRVSHNTTEEWIKISGGSCAAQSTLTFFNRHTYISTDNVELGLPSFSGSFTYELSFLDKAHTLITNIPKRKQLPNGIGEKGYVIIPEQLDQRIKDNIDFYLSKAGLIDETILAKALPRGR
tara:strand:+ start:1998 stop:3365 length:1368 start_codon:yes stop_codon:yes gene_type:complete